MVYPPVGSVFTPPVLLEPDFDELVAASDYFLACDSYFLAEVPGLSVFFPKLRLLDDLIGGGRVSFPSLTFSVFFFPSSFFFSSPFLALESFLAPGSDDSLLSSSFLEPFLADEPDFVSVSFFPSPFLADDSSFFPSSLLAPVFLEPFDSDSFLDSPGSFPLVLSLPFDSVDLLIYAALLLFPAYETVSRTLSAVFSDCLTFASTYYTCFSASLALRSIFLTASPTFWSMAARAY